MSHWKQARWPFVVFVLIEVVIFGSGSAVTKFAYDSITPLWCLAVRFGLATAVFALFFGRRIVARLRSVKVRLWLPQALCMGISYLCCNVALDLTTATNVGFLVALPVVFAPLLSTMVERSRYPRAIIPFQVGVAGGLYLLCSQGGSLAVGPGELLALGSSVALAGALVFGKQALAELDAVTVAGTQIAVAFALCLGCALVAEPMLDVAAVRPVAWGIIVFLALFSTCLAFFLQSLALDRLSSTTVSLLLTGEPVFTALFAYLFLGETLSAMGLLGAAVIVGTVVAATWADGRTPASPTRRPRLLLLLRRRLCRRSRLPWRLRRRHLLRRLPSSRCAVGPWLLRACSCAAVEKAGWPRSVFRPRFPNFSCPPRCASAAPGLCPTPPR